ncbi:MAG: FKBP-type peptidyl-prolyl cis-trans isomerase [Bacteroidota bacterium]
MKTILLSGLFLMLIVTGGCLKDTSCQPKTVASEDAEMQNYAVSNGMSVIQHNSGMYYQIINPGSGAVPNYNSILSVKYTGKLMNGTIFDSRTTSPITLQLGGVIAGWQLGLQLIQKGGIIKLIIPSSMAYGCQPNGPIPGNSILYFEIELVDVQ